MKKRILSFLCALLLCLGCLTASLSVQAADTPCFMAVNDNLLPLEDQYIPITVNGQYYVPYTIFDRNLTGIDLGIYPIYNTILNTLMIYNLDQMLTFDLNIGTCTDRSGISYDTARAVIRNGRIYVPAKFICDYFRLTYSSRVTTYGPLVRIRSAASIVDDNNFVGCAQLLMEERLRDWRKNQTSEEPLVPTPIPTVSTAPEDDPDRSGVRTYLAFQADQTSGLEELLSLLKQNQIQALFFFPAEDLASYDEAVRAVLCGGHAVGLLVTGTTVPEITTQAAEGNQVLAQIAHLRTCTVLAPNVQADTEEALAAAGLLCWETDVSALPDGRSSYSQRNAVLNNMEQYYYEIFVLSDASTAAANLWSMLLPELVENRYDLRLAVETQL